MKYLVYGFLLVLLDQGTKFLVVSHMSEGQSIPLITPMLYLTYVRNPGAAFGFFANQRVLFLGVGILALGLVGYYRHTIKKQNILFKLGVTMATAGAVGNLIDRFRIGMVIDFVDIRIWPIFNVADMIIAAGVALLFWEVLTSGK